MTSSTSADDLHGCSRPNFGVDYVIRYNFADTTKHQVETQFVKLIESLQARGFATEVRYGDTKFILIFVKTISQQKLEAQIYRSRIQNWLHSEHNAAPPDSMQKNFREKPITEAERLRFLYTLIVSPETEGGLGITPLEGKWKCVESIFPLHNHSFNKRWVKNLGSKYFLDAESLTEIKDHFGERIAFYFAFLQSYFLFLTFPAGFGFFAWLFLGGHSLIYAVFNGLWCIIFVEYWKKTTEAFIGSMGKQ